MSIQSSKEDAMSDPRHIWASWLWILAGTLIGGIVTGVGYVDIPLFLTPLGFTLGGILGGVIARYLPTVIRGPKHFTVLSSALPILLIAVGLIFLRELFSEGGILPILTLSGILASSYVVWIPRWTKRLSQKYLGAWWVDVLTIALIGLDTFCILFIFAIFLSQ